MLSKTLYACRNWGYVKYLAHQMQRKTRALVLPLAIAVQWDTIHEFSLPQCLSDPATVILSGNHRVAAMDYLLNGKDGVKWMDATGLPARVFEKKVCIA